MDPKNLKTLKRTELQKLAKQHGVKANMKTGDIVTALENVLNASCEFIKNTPQTSTPSIELLPTPPSDSENDLLSMKPPLSDSDLKCFDSSPEQDSAIEQKIRVSLEQRSPTEKMKRTRSSSRNRASKTNSVESKMADGKTFSVERPKTKPRTDAGKRKAVKPTKRRSKVIADDVIQSKKARRGESDEGETVDEELKNEIMAEIRKKIAESDIKNPKKSDTDDAFASKIPRFAASGVTIGTSKPITPGNKDWNKLHDRRFQQLESIDDYERRKKDRADRLLGSNKKNNATLSRLARPSRRVGAKIVKPVARKGRPVPSFTSPAAVSKSTPKTPHSIMRGSKIQEKCSSQKAANVSIFKPTVTSTKNINLNFAQKSAKVSTPKRVRIVSDQVDKKQTYVKTPGTGMRNRSVLTPGERRKSFATPKGINTSVSSTTPGGSKLQAFDLKESLKKPLSYVPHKGPLRPFNDTAKKPSFQDRIKNVKHPAAGSRDKRRQKMLTEKKQEKDRRMMNRRGIK